MRIISGKKRGLRLCSPQNKLVRPTSDRVKEAMFDVLQNYIVGSSVLDLFSGSGALGIEAWSRGAKKVVLCDNNIKSINDTRNNIKKIGDPPEVELIKNNYKNAIKLFQKKNKFDIVILDPPYKSNFYEDALREMLICEILNNNAIIITESATPIIFETVCLKNWKTKRYGEIFLTYFKYNNL